MIQVVDSCSEILSNVLIAFSDLNVCVFTSFFWLTYLLSYDNLRITFYVPVQWYHRVVLVTQSVSNITISQSSANKTSL